MRTLAVHSSPIAPTFSSADAAIQHSKSYSRSAKARADEGLVTGCEITDAYWSDTDFVIRFSNDRFLHLFVAAEQSEMSVKWGILERDPVLPGVALEYIGSAPVALQFSRAGHYVMDRSALIAARRGKTLTRFFVNEMGIYLYTPRQLTLCFRSVFRVDTGDGLLYVGEEN